MYHKLQKEIISEMRTKPIINPKEEIRLSIDFLKNYLKKHPFLQSLVLGISGGQDSTLTGKLAQMAIDELNEEIQYIKYQFIAIRLPYGVQKDEQDCQDAIQFIQPNKVITLNIKDSVGASVQAFKEATGEDLSDFLKGNVKARERMKVQYDIAGYYKGVVLGTDHSAEAITGFYTKWGDGAADLVPIFRLNKRQGKQLLKELGCPSHLYLKTPTADLEDNQPQLADEDSLGVSYTEIDDYLEGKQINEKSAEVLENHFMKTRHKRNSPISVLDIWWK